MPTQDAHALFRTLFLPLILPAVLLLTIAAAGAASSETGQQLYQQACAACHGAGGTGAPPGMVGFDTPLPDFTDCDFATREADLDWLYVS